MTIMYNSDVWVRIGYIFQGFCEAGVGCECTLTISKDDGDVTLQMIMGKGSYRQRLTLIEITLLQDPRGRGLVIGRDCRVKLRKHLENQRKSKGSSDA